MSDQGHDAGSTPGHDQPPAQPYAQPYAAQPPVPWNAPKDPDARPGTVTAAGIMTIVLSLLAVLAAGVLLVAAAAGRGALEEEVARELQNDPGMRELGLEAGTVLDVVLVVFVVLLVMALVSTVLGFLVLRRSKVARGSLIALSVLTAILSLVSIFSFVSALWLAGSVAVVVLLLTGGAGDWFGRRTPTPTPSWSEAPAWPGPQAAAPPQQGWGGAPQQYPPAQYPPAQYPPAQYPPAPYQQPQQPQQDRPDGPPPPTQAPWG